MPIHRVTGEQDHHGWKSDNLGFLAIDTPSANRLNNTYHLHLLAAYGHQMYNFMSLMRGKYSLVPQQIENERPHV